MNKIILKDSILDYLLDGALEDEDINQLKINGVFAVKRDINNTDYEDDIKYFKYDLIDSSGMAMDAISDILMKRFIDVEGELEKIINKSDFVQILQNVSPFFNKETEKYLKNNIEEQYYYDSINNIYNTYYKFINISSDELDKSLIAMPNMDLLKKQLQIDDSNNSINGIYENILFLQLFRKGIYIELSNINIDINPTKYYTFLEYAYYVDYLLTLLWGFSDDIETKNWNYFKFWEIPQTNQPTMDNNDAYPYGYYSFLQHKHFNINIHNQIINNLIKKINS